MYLYGASGHAKVIVDLVKSEGKDIKGLVDDNESVSELLGYQVLHSTPKNESFIISIGDNLIRKKISEKLVGEVFEIAIHSSAVISENSTIDVGSVVMQGAIIQSSAKIGKHVIINTGASVDHDCVIDDYVHISPQVTLCGSVTIGEGAWIGAGTVITPGVTIGKWCVIGAGSVVTKDIPDYHLAVGNRCKIIKKI